MTARRGMALGLARRLVFVGAPVAVKSLFPPQLAATMRVVAHLSRQAIASAMFVLSV